MTTCDNENGIARPTNECDPPKEYPITWEKPFRQPHAPLPLGLSGFDRATMIGLPQAEVLRQASVATPPTNDRIRAIVMPVARGGA